MEYILEMKDISKTFPGVKALDHVQLQVRPGEVHALMGENGAGKSTLMKILMGIYTKDEGGEILFNGQPYHASTPKEAMDTGVAMIHQELNPILDMTVYENIFVGRELRKNGLVDKKAEIEEAQRLIEECGLHVSPKETLRNLTVAQCQLIEIIKAISINAKVIIMDEPTAAITDREVELLFGHIRRLTRKGVAIIYISHRMDEIFSICDRVSVYRDGQYIGSGDTKDLSEAQLIKMMVGREITDVFPKLDAEIGEVIFEAKNIVRADNKVKNVSFSVRRGEILGIGGLVGAGRSELWCCGLQILHSILHTVGKLLQGLFLGRRFRLLAGCDLAFPHHIAQAADDLRPGQHRTERLADTEFFAVDIILSIIAPVPGTAPKVQRLLYRVYQHNSWIIVVVKHAVQLGFMAAHDVLQQERIQRRIIHRRLIPHLFHVLRAECLAASQPLLELRLHRFRAACQLIGDRLVDFLLPQPFHQLRRQVLVNVRHAVDGGRAFARLFREVVAQAARQLHAVFLHPAQRFLQPHHGEHLLIIGQLARSQVGLDQRDLLAVCVRIGLDNARRAGLADLLQSLAATVPSDNAVTAVFGLAHGQRVLKPAHFDVVRQLLHILDLEKVSFIVEQLVQRDLNDLHGGRVQVGHGCA